MRSPRVRRRSKWIAIVCALHWVAEAAIVYGPLRGPALRWIQRSNPKEAEKAPVYWSGICTRLVAQLHHWSLLPVCLANVVGEPGFWADPFNFTNAPTRAVTTIAAGHFLFDLIAAVRDVKADGWAYVGHGFCAFALFAGASLSKSWQFWSISYFLWEFSTVFVHVMYLLVALGKKKSAAYTVNGFSLMGVFFLARIVWTARLDAFFYASCLRALLGQEHPGPAGNGFVVFAMFACAFLTCLNVFWFYKMAKFALKKVLGGNTGPAARAGPKGAEGAITFDDDGDADAGVGDDAGDGKKGQ